MIIPSLIGDRGKPTAKSDSRQRKQVEGLIGFNCDYLEGAHARVLELMQQTNLEQTVGYGEDEYCEQAREMIRAACAAPDAAVHFLVGGTQTNMTVIAAALRPHQGVLAAESGHIATHETGAVEATGHKVLTLPAREGKIHAAQIREAVAAHRRDASFEHIVQPAMVYLSQPTELGTLYSHAELSEISAACRELGLLLFVDGARLAYALAAKTNDVSLADLAALTDVFYLGGTKCGALFGEAVVIGNPLLQQDFRYLIKQRGGMLAKGRLLGLQFVALLRGGLYTELGRHGDLLAAQIDAACCEKGISMLAPTVTNQLFPIFTQPQLGRLAVDFRFSDWQTVDATHKAVRFVTSWATTQEAVATLCRAIRALEA